MSGWSDGSGIGTLDHEMNNAGAGFMNAVFLLRKEITAAGKIDDYVATMKWYNEFGEVYQDPFEYAGTTADRMRTVSVFRQDVFYVSSLCETCFFQGMRYFCLLRHRCVKIG